MYGPWTKNIVAHILMQDGNQITKRFNLSHQTGKHDLALRKGEAQPATKKWTIKYKESGDKGEGT